MVSCGWQGKKGNGGMWVEGDGRIWMREMKALVGSTWQIKNDNGRVHEWQIKEENSQGWMACTGRHRNSPFKVYPASAGSLPLPMVKCGEELGFIGMGKQVDRRGKGDK